MVGSGRGSVSVSSVGLWACTVSCLHDFDAGELVPHSDGQNRRKTTLKQKLAHSSASWLLLFLKHVL